MEGRGVRAEGKKPGWGWCTYVCLCGWYVEGLPVSVSRQEVEASGFHSDKAIGQQIFELLCIHMKLYNHILFSMTVFKVYINLTNLAKLLLLIMGHLHSSEFQGTEHFNVNYFEHSVRYRHNSLKVVFTD